MLRILCGGLLLITIAGCVPIAGELGASTPAFTMVPDPTYIPKAGDRAYLYGTENGSTLEQIPVLSDVTSFDKYERVTRENDMPELPVMEEQKALQWSPVGTRVYLVKIYNRDHTGARNAAEVRILDGPHKGTVLYTPLPYIAQLKRGEPEQ